MKKSLSIIDTSSPRIARTSGNARGCHRSASSRSSYSIGACTCCSTSDRCPASVVSERHFASAASAAARTSCSSDSLSAFETVKNPFASYSMRCCSVIDVSSLIGQPIVLFARATAAHYTRDHHGENPIDQPPAIAREIQRETPLLQVPRAQRQRVHREEACCEV